MSDGKTAVQKGPLSHPPNPGAPKHAFPRARPQAVGARSIHRVCEHHNGPTCLREAAPAKAGNAAGGLFQQLLFEKNRLPLTVLHSTNLGKVYCFWSIPQTRYVQSLPIAQVLWPPSRSITGGNCTHRQGFGSVVVLDHLNTVRQSIIGFP